MLKPKLKFLIIPCLAAIPALGQTMWRSGTIIVVLYRSNRIIVSAESREGGPHPSDHACKITRLGNNAFFTATGRIKALGRDGKPIMDVVQVAKRAFNETSGHDVRQIGTKWGEMMKTSFESIIGEMGAYRFISNLQIWQIVTGIFGANYGGKLETYEVNVGMCFRPNPQRDDDFLPVFSSYVWGPITPSSVGDTFPFRVFGADDSHSVITFLQGSTPEARAAVITFMKTTPHQNQQTFLPAAAIQFASDVAIHKDEVGGPIDTLELPQYGPSNWAKVKPECDDTKDPATQH